MAANVLRRAAVQVRVHAPVHREARVVSREPP